MFFEAPFLAPLSQKHSEDIYTNMESDTLPGNLCKLFYHLAHISTGFGSLMAAW